MGRRANGYEDIAKTVNLANYTVIEFTSTGNSWDSGFTNGRYNMETVEKYIDKRGAKTEKREQSVLDVLKANAFIVTRPVKDDKGKIFYALTAKIKQFIQQHLGIFADMAKLHQQEQQIQHSKKLARHWDYLLNICCLIIMLIYLLKS